MDGWMDGQTEGQMDAQVDGRGRVGEGESERETRLD